MDRGIKSPNRILFERWGQKHRERHLQRVDDIKTGVIPGSLPDQTKQISKCAKLGKLLKLGSKKQRNQQDRHEQINHDNKILYLKMTKILQEGGGHVSPKRNMRVLSHEPRSRQQQVEESRALTAGNSVNFRLRDYNRHQACETNTLDIQNYDRQIDPQGVSTLPERQPLAFQSTLRSPFRRKWQHNEEGANLVKNRKSLNVEIKRNTDEQIKNGNLKFLSQLQNLKPSIDTKMLLKESKQKEEIVKRISTYPLSIDHNANFSSKRASQIDEVVSSGTSAVSSKNVQLSREEYLKRARYLDNAPKLFDKAFIMANYDAVNLSGDGLDDGMIKGDAYTQINNQTHAWKISSAESDVVDNNETAAGCDEPTSAKFYQQNLLEYNFNGFQEDSQVPMDNRPQNSKGCTRQNIRTQQMFQSHNVPKTGQADDSFTKWPFSESGNQASGSDRRSFVASSVNDQQFKASNLQSSTTRKRHVRLASLDNNKTILLQANQLNEARTVLYRKGQHVDDGYYIIEISTTPDQSLCIAAFDVCSPSTLLTTFKQDKAVKVLKQFGNDFKLIAECLTIVHNGRQLSLRSPKWFFERRATTSGESVITPGSQTQRNQPIAAFNQTDTFPQRQVNQQEFELLSQQPRIQTRGDQKLFENLMSLPTARGQTLSPISYPHTKRKLRGIPKSTNLSVELMNNLIQKSIDDQEKTRNKLFKQQQQRPMIKTMGMQKGLGRYQIKPHQVETMKQKQMRNSPYSKRVKKVMKHDDNNVSLYQSIPAHITESSEGEIEEAKINQMEQEDYANLEIPVPYDNEDIAGQEETIVQESIFDQNRETSSSNNVVQQHSNFQVFEDSNQGKSKSIVNDQTSGEETYTNPISSHTHNDGQETDKTGQPLDDIPRLDSGDANESLSRYREESLKAKSDNMLPGNKVIEHAEAFEPDLIDQNYDIPEEGTDYEYTDYSRTNKTNEQKVNAMSESEKHQEILSERLAPQTAMLPRDRQMNSDLDPMSASLTNQQTPLAGYGQSNQINTTHQPQSSDGMPPHQSQCTVNITNSDAVTAYRDQVHLQKNVSGFRYQDQSEGKPMTARTGIAQARGNDLDPYPHTTFDLDYEPIYVASQQTNMQESDSPKEDRQSSASNEHERSSSEVRKSSSQPLAFSQPTNTANNANQQETVSNMLGRKSSASSYSENYSAHEKSSNSNSN